MLSYLNGLWFSELIESFAGFEDEFVLLDHVLDRAFTRDLHVPEPGGIHCFRCHGYGGPFRLELHTWKIKLKQ